MANQWALAILQYKAVYMLHAWGQGLPELYRETDKNSAIQRYTVYSYTSLYTIQPLHHPSDLGKAGMAAQDPGRRGYHHPLPTASESSAGEVVALGLNRSFSKFDSK